ncbi:MAG TPA: hypothetical protein VD978_06155 [Azospirillum sp.]|nr:hypothetical protein [Azospirillum sp.]
MPGTIPCPARTHTNTLNAARETRSREKRQAVEEAIRQLSEARQAVTFVAIARLAKVSRQYLYNNFTDEITGQRSASRAAAEIVEGVTVPSRTPDEYRHVEAALRNKLSRLENELTALRKRLRKAEDVAERERGKAEYWRDLYSQARTNAAS